MSTVRKRIIGVFAAVAMALGLTFLVASPASAAPYAPGAVLSMDPFAECVWETPGWLIKDFEELGWDIVQGGAQGTPGQNNWKCVYRVSVTVPTGLKGSNKGLGPDDMNFRVPGLYAVKVNYDWAKTCSDQYPGAHLAWAGSNSGTDWPWQCIGDPGTQYQPYDQNNPPAGDAWKLEVLDR